MGCSSHSTTHCLAPVQFDAPSAGDWPPLTHVGKTFFSHSTSNKAENKFISECSCFSASLHSHRTDCHGESQRSAALNFLHKRTQPFQFTENTIIWAFSALHSECEHVYVFCFYLNILFVCLKLTIWRQICFFLLYNHKKQFQSKSF